MVFIASTAGILQSLEFTHNGAKKTTHNHPGSEGSTAGNGILMTD